MDPEPLAKNLGHIHTSFLIVCARTLHTSHDINSEKTGKRTTLGQAPSTRRRLHPLSHKVAHTRTTVNIELAVHACSKLDFIGSACQGFLN